MKIPGLLIFLMTLFISGCLKDDSCKPKTVQSENAAMVSYAAAQGLTVTQHSSGLYYQILNPGTGPAPGIASNVSITYTGKLLDGTVFDRQTTPTTLYPLSGFIAGWQFGLRLIGKGGTIRLIIPSSLGYGCQAAGAIPPNSILDFQVDLVDVQ